MTLAVLLLISVSFLQSAPQAGAEQQPASTPPNSSAQKSQSQSSAKPHTTSKRTRKKKATHSDCDANATSSPASTASNTSSSTSPSPAGSDSAQDPVVIAAPKNCPPPKIIVRHGGTSEPSIQLAGGPTANQAVQKKEAINQLLGMTDENLKKSAGKQLTSVQQDSVTQMRQFVEESKKAMADGDLERARTLAWKAEVLSEDLVNPAK